MEKNIDRLQELSVNGMLTTKKITEGGIHRSEIHSLSDKGILTRFSRGLYVLNDAWEDEFYLLQQRYARGIYSHETALYLLGYSDRTPASYTMTFPQGYNSRSLGSENILVKRVIPGNYEIGIIECEPPAGNTIRIYDLERTLCDILRGNSGDIQIINAAMKKYVVSKERNIHKLMQYADRLHVKAKVLRYLEVLL